jgi:pilus assembly protein CpaB
MAFGIIGISQFVAGGAMCFVLVMTYVMQSNLAAVIAERDAGMILVPVLATTMDPGTVLQAKDIVTMRIDASFVPKAAIRDRRVMVGRTLRERVLASEFLRDERFAPPNPSEGFTAIIAPNTRVLSIDLGHDEQVAGFVAPGDAVDLLVTLPKDGDRVPETVTIAQAVRVLSVGERIVTSAKNEEIVIPQMTLAIPLDVANDVVHAVSIGQPKVALRSEIDFHRRESNGVRTGDLLGRQGTQMTVAEFRAAISEDKVDEWLEILSGDHIAREPIVDPTLLRGSAGRTAK